MKLVAPATATEHVVLKMPELRFIPLQDLKVDPTYQRTVKTKYVKARAARFDSTIFGLVTASKHADGTYRTLDGQQRCAMLRELCVTGRFSPTDGVPCITFEGLSRKQEAAYFHGSNDQAPFQTYDRWRARLIAKDPVACAVDDICTVAKFIKPTCVGALERAYEFSDEEHPRGEHLKTALGIIRKAWGRKASLRGLIVYGIAFFLHRHADAVNLDQLVGALSELTQERMILLAQTAANTRRYKGMRNAIYAEILTAYNDNAPRGEKLR